MRNKKGPLLFLIFLFAIVFLPALRFHFINWDDPLHVYRNQAVISPAPSLSEIFLTPSLGYPIPITVIFYRFLYQYISSNAWVFHLFNLLLHVLNGALLYRLGEKLKLGFWGIWLACSLFLLHPAVVESAVWVSGTKDLLATSFSLFTALQWLTSPSPVLALFFFTLACFSKPSALFLIPLLFWLRKKGWVKVSTREVSFYVLIGFIVFLISFVGQSQVGAIHANSAWGYVRNIWFSIGYHLSLIFYFTQPTPKFIPLQSPPEFYPLYDLLPFLFILLVIYKKAWRSFGFVWAVLSYLPNSNLIPLNRFVSDTYVYTPMIGVALLAGNKWEAWKPGIDRAAGKATSVAILFTFIFTLASQSALATIKWIDGSHLWTFLYEKYPDSPQVCRDLGNAFLEEDRFIDAFAQYTKCGKNFGNRWISKNMGIAYFRYMQFDLAKVWFLTAQKENPRDDVIPIYLKEIERIKPKLKHPRRKL